jgi:phage I-like protein
MKLSIETLTALGLSADATDAQINEAIQTSLNSKPVVDSTVNARFAQIEAQLAEKDAQIAALSAGTGEATRAAQKAQVAAVLSECSDRFVPAEREMLEQLGIDNGADYLGKLLANRPSLASLQTPVAGHGSASPAKPTLTADEKLICSNLGLTDEEFLASQQKLAAAAA